MLPPASPHTQSPTSPASPDLTPERLAPHLPCANRPHSRSVYLPPLSIQSLRAAAPPPGAPSFSYLAVFSNCPLVAAVLTFAIAQSIKVLTTWYALSPLFISTRYKGNRWDAKQLVGSGGMPSSHSATVTALVVTVGL
ncbi:Acid phosphatase/vanadium-dependent haloperoxidase-related protein [Zea mays]|uniref:Acid phosphatase/vanadium-dependent haloperoxidase-related protein n=1 Tax=Zea mays TaxID=4577 RepID=A0A1D6FHP8_MAIZE|nr:Acid phosphatase/vanadium-dependent haloperoxidase-related protein [Zea mays]